MTELAPHLPDGDARRDALTDALTATQSITDHYNRARALTSLAQHLPHDLLVVPSPLPAASPTSTTGP